MENASRGPEKQLHECGVRVASMGNIESCCRGHYILLIAVAFVYESTDAEKYFGYVDPMAL